MNGFMELLKHSIKNFFKSASTAENVKDSKDYQCVLSWIKKVCVLYAVFSAIAILAIVLIIPAIASSNVIPSFFAYLILPCLFILTCWGYATLIIYIPKVIKSLKESAKAGYEIGKNIETTHINVTHEFGNTYRVSSYKDNKGCLVAYISMVLRFVIWCAFCVYVGPFLTFKKLFNSIKNIKAYSAEQG